MATVAPEKTGRVKEVNISLAELAKNIDIDGDGEIEPEEKEILDTLRSMDVDGDGTISLRELVNLGAKLNQQRDQTKFYKRVAYGVMLIAILAILAVFLACFAAVEAAKDSRPGSDGVMKTVVTGQDAKVVTTATYTKSIGLTSLHTATFATLRGIKDIGFKVGNRFYQYTVTGFEQDVNADGSTNVRLFTSRGDSIIVTKTVANLERVQSKQVIDISAAAVQNRRLLAKLSEDHRRHLLNTVDVNNNDGGNVRTDSANEGDISYDPAALQAIYTTENNTDRSLSPFAMTAPCPTYFDKEDEGNCTCRGGFYKGKAVFNSVSSAWETEKDCELYPIPDGVGWWIDKAEKRAYIYCPFTDKEILLQCEDADEEKCYWEFPNNGTKCEKPKLPMYLAREGGFTNRSVLVDHSKIATSSTPHINETKFETKAKCAIGFSSTSEKGPHSYDPTTETWMDPCTGPVPLPPNTKKITTGNQTKDILACIDDYYQAAPYRWFQGFPWSPEGKWVSHMKMQREMQTFNEKKHLHDTTKDAPNMTVVIPSPEPSSECLPKQPGYKYVCDDSGACYREEVDVQGSDAAKVIYDKFDNNGNPYRLARCASGYSGMVIWHKNNVSWTHNCVMNMPPCPPETIKVTGTQKCACNPRSHVGPGYEFQTLQNPQYDMTSNMLVLGKYSKLSDNNLLGCTKKNCPEKTVDRSITVTELDCQCLYAVSDTNGMTKYNTTSRKWDTANCSSTATYTCPVNSALDANTGDCVCTDPNGHLYKKKPSMETCDSGAPDNGCTIDYQYDNVTSELLGIVESTTYIQAKATAATEDWVWYGTCPP